MLDDPIEQRRKVSHVLDMKDWVQELPLFPMVLAYSLVFDCFNIGTEVLTTRRQQADAEY